MTTMTIPNTRPAKMLPPVQVAPAITIGTLTRVELRKLVNTRANRWLIGIALVGTGAAVALWFTLLDLFQGDVTWLDPLFLVSSPLSVLLPVLAVLTFTQEWGQRTSLTTFALEPRRGRVIGAKLLALGAVTVLGAVVFLAASTIAAVLTGPLTDKVVVWSGNLVPLGSAVILLAIAMASGAGFGMFVMNSPAAIALYFIIPVATASASTFPGVIGQVGQWLSGDTWGLILTPMTTTQ